nr:hypothetical protein CFP56_52406 [Quercus suber]
MTTTKSHSDHVENVEQPRHEAELAGALALANLFSNCVEAFGLIRSAQKWEREEQLLLVRLGIQQARLLIWGDIVGISSPPKTVTDRAVPRHPSAAYPDLKEPTFFAARDARLDEPETRTKVEQALSAIVDRSMQHTREEMMKQYGLAPPKRLPNVSQQALDTARLEGFREKFELLQEVAESYAQFSTRRSNSIIQTHWVIADNVRFGHFLQLTQVKVDYLINTLNVKEGVDRGMRIDIRAFGWHLTNDKWKAAQDASKLRLIAEACGAEYPEYVKATEQALAQIQREAQENAINYHTYAKGAQVESVRPKAKTHHSSSDAHEHIVPHDNHSKRPGLLHRLSKTFGRTKSHHTSSTMMSDSVSSLTSEPERAKSDAGPVVSTTEQADLAPLEPVRSKSVGALPEMHTDATSGPLAAPLDGAIVQNPRARSGTDATVHEPLADSVPVANMISRHDQYHGIARTATKDLRQ